MGERGGPAIHCGLCAVAAVNMHRCHPPDAMSSSRLFKDSRAIGCPSKAVGNFTFIKGSQALLNCFFKLGKIISTGNPFRFTLSAALRTGKALNKFVKIVFDSKSQHGTFWTNKSSCSRFPTLRVLPQYIF